MSRSQNRHGRAWPGHPRSEPECPGSRLGPPRYHRPNGVLYTSVTSDIARRAMSIRQGSCLAEEKSFISILLDYMALLAL